LPKTQNPIIFDQNQEKTKNTKNKKKNIKNMPNNMNIHTKYEQTKDAGMLEINHWTIIKHQQLSTNNHDLIKIGFGVKIKS
jgi:hypothetical protein